ncbi:hypothetical protein J6590_048782 [Homalodisca vitripennis]|nr:hypothetical protein J6590_048782 [Homalodisca vitripennis]
MSQKRFNDESKNQCPLTKFPSDRRCTCGQAVTSRRSLDDCHVRSCNERYVICWSWTLRLDRFHWNQFLPGLQQRNVTSLLYTESVKNIKETILHFLEEKEELGTVNWQHSWGPLRDVPCSDDTEGNERAAHSPSSARQLLGLLDIYSISFYLCLATPAQLHIV